MERIQNMVEGKLLGKQTSFTSSDLCTIKAWALSPLNPFVMR